MKHGRVLVVSHYPPDPRQVSGSKRVVEHMQWLRMDGWAVDFFATNGIPDPLAARRIRRMGIAVYAPDSAELETLLDAGRPELALFEFWQAAEQHLPLVRELSPNTRVLVDATDLQLLREGRRAAGKSLDRADPRRLTEEFGSEVARELNVYAASDGVLAPSREEADLINDLAGAAIALSVPDAGLKLKAIPLRSRRGVAFVGSFSQAQDAGAAEFLCKEIVPRLDSRLLQAHPVLIVGSALEETILGYGRGHEEHVRMVGWVPSVIPYLARTRVSVTPVLHGGGTKRELLQSLMAGTPAVATSIGVEGIDAVDSEHVLLADHPEEFAQSITRLLENDALWRRVARSGRRSVEGTHAEGVVKEEFLRAMNTVLERTPKKQVPPVPTTKRYHERIRHHHNEKILPAARMALDRLAPRGATVAVVSQGNPELLRLGRHSACHFPSDERGYYRGNPPSASEAIELLKLAHSNGSTLFFIPATSRWWFDHYKEFTDYLGSSCRVLLDDESLGVIYAINAQRGAVRTDVQRIESSGLFDEGFYRDNYSSFMQPDCTPLEDFCSIGWTKGRQPNAYFAMDWYVQRHSEVASSGINPLLHYIDSEGHGPNPLFDPGFYRTTYMDGASTPDALADYLAHVRRGEWRNSVPLFDVDYYLAANPDIARAKLDPVLHYMHTGHREGRDPSAHFRTSYYRARYLKGSIDVNPLVHYYETPPAYRRPTKAGRHDLEEEVTAQISQYVASSPAFEELNPTIAAGALRHAKVIAFYLPQFHAIPENDAWWGAGFTEWRNVMRGAPRFAGHYQPRTPRDLGFYDLSDGVTLRKQIELARSAGVHGFSFYYYWFNGKRLLERPLEQLLADRSLDFPFCITWANENWTRRWDGRDDEILIAQEYDPQLDTRFVDDLQRNFDDERYIRVGGRPLLIVYRVDSIPEAATTIERWRRLWRTRHGEEPLIFQVQAFGSEDPRASGADGAVEFPPHKLVQDMAAANGSLRILDPSFGGHVFDYEAVVEAALAQETPEYPLARTAVPSWDNDARRQGQGLVLRASTPQLYERWLQELVLRSADHPVFGERLVFVNAWNEWAEAAYLEPDVHYGSAYLNATARAVCAPSPQSAKRKVLLVGHDAHQHGAQHIVWHIGDRMRNQFGCEVAYLLLESGLLLPKFERLGRVCVASDPDEIQRFLSELGGEGYSLALTNTAVTGPVVPLLKDAGFRVVSLIHELPGIIAEYELKNALEQIVDRSDAVVVPAAVVAEAHGLAQRSGVVTRPQGIYHRFEPPRGARSRLREELGIPPSTPVVLNVGFADYRKGVDVFLGVAEQSARERRDLRFVWVGNVHHEFESAASRQSLENVHFVPYTDDIGQYFAAADVFFLSSREDPFPSVVLEALQAGLPVVAFRGSGGAEELAAAHGAVVERDDVIGALEALHASVAEDTLEAQKTRSRIVRDRFRYDEYCFDLLRLLEPDTKKISVVIPNFNYRNYLRSRLLSIFEQGYPVFEVIVLDDASTDESIEELKRIQAETGRHIKIIRRARNSGSTFQQWVTACRQASGDYLWIAEADDLAKPEFLERLAPLLEERVAYVFSDSMLIDGDGHLLGDSYNFYYRAAGASRMEADFVSSGDTFVRECLAERNLVLNVSAVIWNRACLRQALNASLKDLRQYKLTGDWHLYVAAALKGRRVGYVAEALNIHRRHDRSVTSSLAKRRHVDEVQRVHDYIVRSLDVDETARARMSAYAAELERQFGLAGAGRDENVVALAAGAEARPAPATDTRASR
jgi:glycosyltransferase involved in cell wall biosynthesis